MTDIPSFNVTIRTRTDDVEGEIHYAQCRVASNLYLCSRLEKVSDKVYSTELTWGYDSLYINVDMTAKRNKYAYKYNHCGGEEPCNAKFVKLKEQTLVVV